MKIAILFSGTGSNMRKLVACHQTDNIEIELLLTNNPLAGGLPFARGSGIATAVCDHRLFKSREDHENAVHRILRNHDIELICLAGYMRVLTAKFINRWTDRIINIHPSLLPDFPGLHTHQRVLDAGLKVHGCSVHRVTERVDDGPILGQRSVPVLPDDTAETLAARVLIEEHKLYPAVLRSICNPGSSTTL